MKLKKLRLFKKAVAVAASLSMLMTGVVGTNVYGAEADALESDTAAVETAAEEANAAEEIDEAADIVTEEGDDTVEACAEAIEAEDVIEESSVSEDEAEADDAAINAAEDEAAALGDNRIDVYDIVAILESDTAKYNNHITVDAWKNQLVTTAGVFNGTNKEAGVATFDNLDVNYYGTDRLYAAADSELVKAGIAQKNNSAAFTSTYPDRYAGNGGYYVAGGSKTDGRFVTINNVKAGDLVDAYIVVTKASAGVLHFKNVAEGGTQDDTVPLEGVVAANKHSFIAKENGDFIIADMGGSDPKPLYQRIKVHHGVNVTGAVNTADYNGEFKLTFLNLTTGDENAAKLDGKNFAVTLAPEYTYRAVVSGTGSYGPTIASRDVKITDADSVAGGKSGVSIVLEEKTTCKYSGSIVGFDPKYNTDKVSVTLVADKSANADDVVLTLDGDLGFTAIVQPDVKYSFKLEGANDYVLKDMNPITFSKDVKNAVITVEKTNAFKATGSFVGLDGQIVKNLRFENVDDGYEYAANVDDESYSVSLRDGAYLAKATVDGFSTSTHVVIDGQDVEKDILFVNADKSSLPLKKDLYVGCGDKENNFDTIREAVAAAARMNPASEADRITIHIAAGTYREQVYINTPYISLVREGLGEVIVTWYYGIDYLYYSVGANGLYDEERAFDKYEKNAPQKWGAAVYVDKLAKAFRAENIVFENSFNRYLTDEEVEDGVKLLGNDGNVSVDRKYGADVQSKAATERAAALLVYSDESEFKNCSFLSSQDTLFTGNVDYHVYFKNCFIEGQTDYIFGDANAVFDSCVLSFKGYSAGSQGGYITAAKDVASKGYLFRNCTVTKNSKLDVQPGYFGRCWGAKARVTFLNTKLDDNSLIVGAGWTDMSGALAKDANFKEYGTEDLLGEKSDTSNRVEGTVLTESAAKAIKVTDYFGSWTPSFYSAGSETVAFAENPRLLDNGDINMPYPGHTLTVKYSLGENDGSDVSKIEWYRVNAAGPYLVKTSYANADKSFKITKDEVGTNIKVVVTPMTIDGHTGTAKEYTLAEKVRAGYDDPVTGSDAEPSDGINIYLAGDSTVKDYSASGMYMSNKNGESGSWGEYLQCFFDKEQVNVIDYANGGRSCRTFYNEGTLDTIKSKLKEGDYLFIQFGHNDSSADYPDRFVPLGTPDSKGIYPSTEPTVKKADGTWDYNSGGTYKWFLQQYIDAAESEGAIPVLVTPVSRMYYNAEGKIKDHHDVTKTLDSYPLTTGNAYVQAVKQLAEENDIECIDAFSFTKDIFEDAYAACGNDSYGYSIMTDTSDKTHNNKLGGVIEAALMAKAIQDADMSLAETIVAPKQVMGESVNTKRTVFTIDGAGKLVAYDNKDGYVSRQTYWEGVGQQLFDDIAAVADTAEKFDVTVKYVEGSTEVASKKLAENVSTYTLRVSTVSQNVPAHYEVTSVSVDDVPVLSSAQVDGDSEIVAYVKKLSPYHITVRYVDAEGKVLDSRLLGSGDIYGSYRVRLSEIASKVNGIYEVESAKIGTKELTSSIVVKDETEIVATVKAIDKPFSVSVNYILSGDGSVLKSKYLAVDATGDYQITYANIAAKVPTGYKVIGVLINGEKLPDMGSVTVAKDTLAVAEIVKDIPTKHGLKVLATEETIGDVVKAQHTARVDAEANKLGTKDAPLKVPVMQASDDTAAVIETFISGKVKSREIDVKPHATVVVTIQQGIKYNLPDFGALVEPVDKTIASVNKKGVAVVKVNKTDSPVEVTLKYSGLSDSSVIYTVILHAVRIDKFAAANFVGDEKHTATFDVKDICSGRWMIGKEILEPGKSVPAMKKDVKLGSVELSVDGRTLTVRTEKGVKGAIKFTAIVNGKKYAGSVKIK